MLLAMGETSVTGQKKQTLLESIASHPQTEIEAYRLNTSDDKKVRRDT